MNKLLLCGLFLFSSSVFALKITVDIAMKYKDIAIEERCSIDAHEIVKFIHTPIIITVQNYEEAYDRALIAVKVQSESNGRRTLLAKPVLLVDSENPAQLTLNGAIKDALTMLEIRAKCN